MERVPMTQEAYNKRKAEIDEMENVQMPAIAEKIAEARAEGDLKENAEYHAQRENQSHLHRKISELKSRLSRAQIVDPNQIPKDQVAFGATVKVLDVDLDDEEEITLVGDGDEDYDGMQRGRHNAIRRTRYLRRYRVVTYSGEHQKG